MTVQPKKDLEKFFTNKDPWDYETNPYDRDRKEILLNQLKKLPKPKKVLDIGCGHGFITRDLPGDKVIGVDIAENAVKQAKKNAQKHVSYVAANLFDLLTIKQISNNKYDLIIITGVLYSQYIGESNTAVYEIIDDLLNDNGYLVSVHINEWYKSSFPYPQLNMTMYKYREYMHILEVYKKI